MSLSGIDVSKWQTATPPLTGLSFIVVRATVGAAVDSMYATHYANARKAGLVVMAYHYGAPDATIAIADQVAQFLVTAKDADFLWIDQEAVGFDDAQTQRFVDGVRAAGRLCGLYHSSSGFAGVNADARWVADWRAASVAAGHPMTPDGSAEFSGWDLWQYNGGGADGIDNDFQNPARPLAGLLRRGYVTKAASDAAVKVQQDANALMAAKYEAELADLTAKVAADDDLIAADTGRILQLQSTLATDQALLVKAASDLAAAPGVERERIALALGTAEADRVRAL